MKALGWKSDYRSIFSLESCSTLDNSKCGSIANRGSHVQDVQKCLLNANVNVNVRVVESAIVSPTQFNRTLAPRSPNAAMAPTQTLQEPTRLWMVHHPKVLHSIGLRNGRSCCLHLLRYRYCFFFSHPHSTYWIHFLRGCCRDRMWRRENLQLAHKHAQLGNIRHRFHMTQPAARETHESYGSIRKRG